MTKPIFPHFTLGTSFFEVHTQMAIEKQLDNDHVIVDRKDYDMVLSFLRNNKIGYQDIAKNQRKVQTTIE